MLTDGRSKQVLLNNATITCVEGVWVPNPFPICIPGGIQERIENDIILNTKENGTNPMVNESHCRGALLMIFSRFTHCSIELHLKLR